MSNRSPLEKAHAFSRIDVLVIAAACVLIGVVALSVRGNVADASEKAVCLGNLRHIGRAFQLWASDHQDQYPMWLDFADGGMKPPAEGFPPGSTITFQGLGTFPWASRNTAWFQFIWIHRELQTPAVLVCPADVARARAQTFSNSPAAGYTHVNYQDRATSYGIWIDMPIQFSAGPIVSDRHVRPRAYEICSNFGFGAYRFQAYQVNQPPTGPDPLWTDLLHNASGNLFFNDGRAEEFSSPMLGRHFGVQENAFFHLTLPQ